jgi:hypothetical protein
MDPMDEAGGKARSSLRVNGYRVITYNDEPVGEIVEESENMLVVECGHWPRKIRHALPKRYASVDESTRSVRMQLSKELLASSPRLAPNQPIDERAVAGYFGLDDEA